VNCLTACPYPWPCISYTNYVSAFDGHHGIQVAAGIAFRECPHCSCIRYVPLAVYGHSLHASYIMCCPSRASDGAMHSLFENSYKSIQNVCECLLDFKVLDSLTSRLINFSFTQNCVVTPGSSLFDHLRSTIAVVRTASTSL